MNGSERVRTAECEENAPKQSKIGTLQKNVDFLLIKSGLKESFANDVIIKNNQYYHIRWVQTNRFSSVRTAKSEENALKQLEIGTLQKNVYSEGKFW